MKKRVITGAVLTVVCVPILIFSKYIIYPILLSLLAVVAMVELFRCIGLSQNYALSVPSYVVAGAMPTLAYLMRNNSETLLLFSSVLAIVLLFAYFAVAVAAKGALRFDSVCAAYALTLYVVSGFTAMSAVRYVERGGYCLVLLLFASGVSDTFAYLFGSRFGKHKLIEQVSPKKTVEGSVAGIAFATLFFVAYGLIVDFAAEGVTVNYLVLILSGIVLSVISQIGDLVASLVKREHGIKDYGKIFPGHGGVMDRFDSMLAVAMPLLIACVAFPPFS